MQWSVFPTHFLYLHKLVTFFNELSGSEMAELTFLCVWGELANSCQFVKCISLLSLTCMLLISWVTFVMIGWWHFMFSGLLFWMDFWRWRDGGVEKRACLL